MSIRKYLGILEQVLLGRELPGEKGSFQFGVKVGDVLVSACVECGVIKELSTDKTLPPKSVVFNIEPSAFDELLAGTLLLQSAFMQKRVSISGPILKAMGLAAKLQSLIKSSGVDFHNLEDVESRDDSKTSEFIIEEEIVEIPLGDGEKVTAHVRYSDEIPVAGLHIILPPDPMLGGNSDNSVVKAIAEHSVGSGFISAALNYRGVGTAGVDENMFEWWENLHKSGDFSPVVSDCVTAVQQLQDSFQCEERVAVTGYSFGSIPALGIADKVGVDTVSAMVLLAPPLNDLPIAAKIAEMSRLPETMLMVPDRDEFVTEDSLKEIESISEKITTEKVDADSHFLHGKEDEVSINIMEFLCRK